MSQKAFRKHFPVTIARSRYCGLVHFTSKPFIYSLQYRIANLLVVRFQLCMYYCCTAPYLHTLSSSPEGFRRSHISDSKVVIRHVGQIIITRNVQQRYSSPSCIYTDTILSGFSKH